MIKWFWKFGSYVETKFYIEITQQQNVKCVSMWLIRKKSKTNPSKIIQRNCRMNNSSKKKTTFIAYFDFYLHCNILKWNWWMRNKKNVLRIWPYKYKTLMITESFLLPNACIFNDWLMRTNVEELPSIR